MAILLEVKAPDGWRWRGVTAGEGAEGLSVTHGDLGEGRMKVLLDGVFWGESGEPLLWLWIDRPLRPGEGVTVTGEGGGELILYVLRDGGAVEEIPLSVEWDGGEERTETHEEATETETETENKTETETETDTETDTETETGGITEEIAPPDTEETSSADIQSPPTATFLGCRETGAEGGMYTVQFLFGGEGVGTPVLCMEGGGLLYLSCGTVEGLSGERGREVRRLCTVDGLSADRRYVFWVGNEDGWVTVTYEGGIFYGFGSIGKRDTK